MFSCGPGARAPHGGAFCRQQASSCASRLIPGQSALGPSARKSPHMVSADGSIRVADDGRSAHKLANPSDLADCIVPTPFAGGGWQLWSILLADHVIILTSWIIVGVAVMLLVTKLFGRSVDD